MAKSFKSLLEVMVPQSAKKGSAIENQWLEPASYDEKMVAAMKGEPDNIYDQEAPENQADNFKAQDLVKKNRKLPLRQGGLSEAMGENAVSSSDDDHVNEAYEVESLDLLEEIMDLIEGSDIDDNIHWRTIAGSLKEARDCLIRCCVNESLNEEIEYLDEAFKAGNIKLHDGSTIKLSKEDAKALNIAVSGTKSQKEMLADVTKNKQEFNQFLGFARNLKEDYSATLDNLLEQLTPEQLQEVIDQDLSEGEVWNSFAGGVKTGAKAGGKIGQALGAAGGAAYGGAAGLAVGVGKAVAMAKKRKEQEKSVHEAKDPNNEKESILGTSAPAMDSDPNNAKPKKPLKEEEVSEGLKDFVKRNFTKAGRQAVRDQAKDDHDHMVRLKKSALAKSRRSMTISGASPEEREKSEHMTNTIFDPKISKLRKKAGIKESEEQLDEISKETAEKYVKRATGEHTMANMARRSLEGQPSTDGGKALAYWKRQEQNRKKGISRAFNTIDKDEK